jgi:GNAT superfamily N-acetyltransferase
MSADAIWVALNQEQPIGYAMLRRQGGNNAWHQGTGVERPYRGKGVARLLKLHAIRWALRNGVDFLYTGNDVDNPRMYAINMRLGYQPLPATIEVVRDLRS